MLTLDFNHGSTRSRAVAARITDAIDAALAQEAAARDRRTYLGGSILGDPCARRLQLDYQGVPRDVQFSGRTLRIFETGHVMEDLAARWIRLAGVDLRTRDGSGEQFGFSVASGRIRGHIDGVVVAGLAFVEPMLWECKSANAKNWQAMVKDGVREAKPIYAAQIAIYQAYMGLTEAPALFTAVNKDTSELHHELVHFDAALAQETSDRGVAVLRAADAGEILPRITRDPEHFECRMCDWRETCWRN